MAGITSTKKIKGQPHLLAYITPNEVEKLKALGGQETMTKEGIPAYPEFDNYTESSLANTSSAGSGMSRSEFEGGAYSGTGNAGDGIIQQYDNQFKELKKKEELTKQKAKEEILFNSKVGRNKRLNAFQRYNSKFQRQRNLDLAKKRAFQKYKNVEQYVDPFDDYTMSGQKMAELRGYTFDDQGNITGYDRNKATAYGYDTSKLGKGMDTLTSNKGTSIEKTRPNLYDVNSMDYGLVGMGFNKIRPDTQRTVLNTLGKAAEYNVLGINAPNMTNLEISDEMNRLKNLGRTQDQIDFINNGGGGGGGEAYIPYLPPEEDAEEEEKYTYRFGTGQNVGADVTRGSYIFNQGGRVPRNMGGIMGVVPRQGYFLGKIVKGVGDAIGGVAKAAGKVLKSDFGKAAVMALGGYYLGGGTGLGGAKMFGNTGFSMGNIGSGISSLGKKLLLKPGMNFGDKGALSLSKILGLSAALPFIPGINKAPENEDIGMTARGGRLIDPLTGEEGTPASMRDNIELAKQEAAGDPIKLAQLNQKYNNMLFTNLPYENYGLYANGGRIARAEGGLMDLGGMEKDYRAEGGFVPIGKAEKADDVPARLSVNEFVFTADAVRNAGGGDIDKGAEVMENMMKNLENGGRVSEESQGNTGAKQMFSVSERIGEVI